MLTKIEQDELDLFNSLAETDPESLSDADLKRGVELENKAKEPVKAKRTPEQIKSEGEAEYANMMQGIESTKNKASSYGGTDYLRSPVGNFALSLVAPATAEAYANDRMPSLGEGAFDLGLGLATAYATPARAAGALGKVAPKVGRLLAPTTASKIIAGEAIKGGISAGAGEGILSAMNGRDYNLMSPLLGAGIGAGAGGLGAFSRSKAIKSVMDKYPNKITIDEAGDLVDNYIKTNRSATVKNANEVYSKARQSIASPEIVDLVKARNAERVAKSAGKDINVVNLGVQKERYIRDLYEPVIKENLSKQSRKVQESVLNEALDDIKANTNKITGTPDLDITTAIIERYQKTNPELAKMLTDVYIVPEFAKYKQTQPAPFAESMKQIMVRQGIDPNVVDLHVPESIRLQSPMDVDLPTTQVANEAMGKIANAARALEAPTSLGTINVPVVSQLTGIKPEVSINAVKALQNVSKPVVSPVLSYPQAFSQTDDEGNLIYAPRGRISYEELFKD